MLKINSEVIFDYRTHRLFELCLKIIEFIPQPRGTIGIGQLVNQIIVYLDFDSFVHCHYWSELQSTRLLPPEQFLKWHRIDTCLDFPHLSIFALFF